jgi:hypothetical protein
VEAKQHLAARSAVKEHKRGVTLAVARIRRPKKLTMQLHAIRRQEEYSFRLDEFCAWVGNRGKLRREILQGATRVQQRGAKRGVLIGTKNCDPFSLCYRCDLNACAVCQRLRFASRRGDGPDVTAIDILLV